MVRYKHIQAHLNSLDTVLNENCQPPWELCCIVQAVQGVLLVIVRKKDSDDAEGRNPTPATAKPRPLLSDAKDSTSTQ